MEAMSASKDRLNTVDRRQRERVGAVTLDHPLRYPRSCSTQILPSGSEKLAKLA